MRSPESVLILGDFSEPGLGSRRGVILCGMDNSVPSARLNCLRAEGELLAQLTAADPGAPVPTCPGWSTTDVLGPGMLMLAQGTGPSGTVQLNPVDDPRSWSLDLDADMRGVVRQPGGLPAASVLAATASDLLLWAWNRLADLSRISVAGEPGVLTAWASLVI
jgi:hypothetical protein